MVEWSFWWSRWSCHGRRCAGCGVRCQESGGQYCSHENSFLVFAAKDDVVTVGTANMVAIRKKLWRSAGYGNPSSANMSSKFLGVS